MKENIYNTQPYATINDVPIFVKDDQYVENYDRIASDLLSGMEETGQNPFIQEELWSAAEIDTVNQIKKYIKPGDRVLDVGVGTGRLLSYLDDSDVDKWGIDISLDMAELSSTKGITACKGDVQHLPYVDNAFDIVVCTDVLEHVFDLHQTVAEIKRVLREGGVLITRTPNKEDLSPYLESSYPYYFVHLRTFDASALELYFTRVFGFDFIDSQETMYKLELNKHISLFKRRVVSRIKRWFPKIANMEAIKKRYYVNRAIEIIGVLKKTKL